MMRAARPLVRQPRGNYRVPMTRHSSRAAISPFLAMETAREAALLAASGRTIVRFDVGQPDGPAPKIALEAVASSLGSTILGYTEALGLRPLRERLSRLYRDRYGVEISPDRIVITTGSSGGFLLAFLALFETGDRIAMAAPGYPPYRHILTSLGMEAAIIEAGPEDRYQLTPDNIAHLAETRPLAGVLVASPANPTGTILNKAELGALAEAAKKVGASLIVDEIYHGLNFSQPAPSILEVSQEAIVVSSFSKYFAMTGWRVGWLVLPERLVKPVERLAQNLFICPPHVSQVAALAAMEAEVEMETRAGVYAANRTLILDALPGLGIRHWAPADGAFYVYADISALTNDSLDWCKRALHEAGVAMTAGVDFDAARGHHWVRIAYARSTREVAEGLERLNGWNGR